MIDICKVIKEQSTKPDQWVADALHTNVFYLYKTLGPKSYVKLHKDDRGRSYVHLSLTGKAPMLNVSFVGLNEEDAGNIVRIAECETAVSKIMKDLEEFRKQLKAANE